MAGSKMLGLGDSSVLLAFAAVERLDLLAVVFDEIWVSPAVQREVTAADESANRRLRDALAKPGLLRPFLLPAEAVSLAGCYLSFVDQGEAEAIAAAKIWNMPVLLDDLAARRLARAEGVAVIGSLGLLLRCKEVGRLPAVRPVAEAMRDRGRYFSRALLNDLYVKAGEE